MLAVDTGVVEEWLSEFKVIHSDFEPVVFESLLVKCAEVLASFRE